MGDISCPITINERVVSATLNSTARSIVISAAPVYRSVTATISLGRRGEQGEQGPPGGLAIISAGSTSSNGSFFHFADSNNVSFGLSGDTITASISPTAQSIQTQGSVVILGSSGAISFANGNGVTFGGNQSTITASHNGLTTAAQVSHSHGNPTLALTNLTGTTASSSNGLTISLSGQSQSSFILSDSNGLSFGTTGSTVTASHNGLTTAAQVSHSHGNPTLALTNLTGTTASGSNGLTLSISAQATGDHTHGNTPTLALTNMFGTASSNSGGLTLSLSVNATATGTAGGSADGYNIIGVNGSSVHSAATIQFSNSNNVSFGLAGSTVTASASYPTQTAFILSDSNGLSFGTTGSTVTASHNGLTTAAQVSHSHGNPTLALTNLTGTTASASNGLTISLSAPVAGLTTAMASDAGSRFMSTSERGNYFYTSANTFANSTHSHGNPTLALTNLTGTTASASNGLTISLSAPVAGLTTAMASDAGSRFMSTSERGNYFYTSANTFANSTHSHGNPTLALTNLTGTTYSGSNGFTLSLSVDPPGVGGGGVAISAGTQSVSTGTLVFSNANNVVFGMSGSTRVTASVNNVAAVAHSHGNPTLALTNISGTTASASNGLTLSLSAPVAGLTTAAQSDHSHGNPTLALTNLTGTTASASNGLTISLSAQTGLTTAAQSNHSHGNPTLALTNLTGTTASASNGLTISLSAPVAGLTTAAQSNHSHGNPTLALTNISGTTASASNGLTLSLSAPSGLTTAAQVSHSHGNPTLALTNLTGTTASSSNGLTISLSNLPVAPTLALTNIVGTTSTGTGGATLSLSIAAYMRTSERVNYFYTSANTFANSTHSHGNPTLALTNITGTTASGSNGLTLSLSAGVGGGGGVAISAGTQSVSTGTLVFSNSNNVTFGMSGSSRITASVDAAVATHSHGNPTLALTNISGTTASASNGLTISLSAGVGGPGGGIAIGNSEVTYTSGTASLAASGALTIASGTGQRMLFSVPQTSVLAGVNLTVSTTGSTISLSVQQRATVSTFIPYYPASTGAQTMGATGTSSASAWFFPISVLDPVRFNQIEQLMTCSYITSTVSGQQSITQAFGLYSNNAGTLSLISSGSYSMALTNSSVSATLSYPTAYGTAGGYTYRTTTASTTAQAHSLFGTAGNRIFTCGFGGIMELTDGMYWLGFHQRMSSSSANVGLVPALAGNVMAAAQNAGPIGSNTVAYSQGSNATFKFGWGVALSTESAGYGGTNVPANFPLSVINNTVTIMPMMTFISR